MDEDFPPPPFAGFPAEGFAFLEELARRQDRDWMAANKAVYERTLREPLSALVADLSDRLASLPLRGDPKRALFRLNRDVRFSKDKRPYKAHASAVLSRDGSKAGAPGVLYIHVDPTGSFAAAGFFRPEPDILHRLRRAIAADEAALDELTDDLAAADLSLASDEELTRLPKGFGPVSPSQDAALKRKSWHVKRDLPPALMATAALADALEAFATAAAPLLHFGWSALERHASGETRPRSAR